MRTGSEVCAWHCDRCAGRPSRLDLKARNGHGLRRGENANPAFGGGTGWNRAQDQQVRANPLRAHAAQIIDRRVWKNDIRNWLLSWRCDLPTRSVLPLRGKRPSSLVVRPFAWPKCPFPTKKKALTAQFCIATVYFLQGASSCQGQRRRNLLPPNPGSRVHCK